jgi:hypothetical protein
MLPICGERTPSARRTLAPFCYMKAGTRQASSRSSGSTPAPPSCRRPARRPSCHEGVDWIRCNTRRIQLIRCDFAVPICEDRAHSSRPAALIGGAAGPMTRRDGGYAPAMSGTDASACEDNLPDDPVLLRGITQRRRRGVGGRLAAAPPPNWSCGRWRPSPKNGHRATNTNSDGPAWRHACRPATQSPCSSTSLRVAILRVANMPCSEGLKCHGQPFPDIRAQALLRLSLVTELICPQFVVMQAQAGNLTLAECTTVKDEVDQVNLWAGEPGSLRGRPPRRLPPDPRA